MYFGHTICYDSVRQYMKSPSKVYQNNKVSVSATSWHHDQPRIRASHCWSLHAWLNLPGNQRPVGHAPFSRQQGFDLSRWIFSHSWASVPLAGRTVICWPKIVARRNYHWIMSGWQRWRLTDSHKFGGKVTCEICLHPIRKLGHMPSAQARSGHLHFTSHFRFI